jgi:uncharacterized protein YdeI (YjbR/CyaY-like superfamily)
MAKRRPLEDIPRVEVKARAELRAWLVANHAESDGVWLATYKKHRPEHYLAWGEIVQELLCFGWIDGLTRRLDEDRSMIYVCPRKRGSGWSRINKGHIEALEAAGLIEAAGRAVIDRAKADGSWSFLDDIEALVVPGDLATALDALDGARAGYEGFTIGQKKQLLWWVKSAKRAATRASRIAATAEAAAQGRPAYPK